MLTQSQSSGFMELTPLPSPGMDQWLKPVINLWIDSWLNEPSLQNYCWELFIGPEATFALELLILGEEKWMALFETLELCLTRFIPCIFSPGIWTSSLFCLGWVVLSSVPCNEELCPLQWESSSLTLYEISCSLLYQIYPRDLFKSQPILTTHPHAPGHVKKIGSWGTYEHTPVMSIVSLLPVLENAEALIP